MPGPFEDLTSTQTAESSFSASGGVPFWGDAPESWDTVSIAGWKLPGICRVTGRVKRRVDSKKAAGVNGKRVTYVSDDVAQFSVTVRLWTADHLKTYENLLKFLRSLVLSSSEGAALSTGAAERLIDQRQKALPDSSKFPLVPVEIRHPALDLLRIKAAHVMEYGLPAPDGEAAEGIYLATIEFEEYVPDSIGKRGKVKTPRGAVDASISSRGPGAIGRKLQQPKPSEVNANSTEFPVLDLTAP